MELGVRRMILRTLSDRAYPRELAIHPETFVHKLRAPEPILCNTVCQLHGGTCMVTMVVRQLIIDHQTLILIDDHQECCISARVLR